METLKNKYLNTLTSFIETSTIGISVESNSGMIIEHLHIINEGEGGLTFYELRQFLTVLLKQTRNADTKKVLDDILKTVSKLEIMKVPIPTIKKQKSISPNIFK